MECQPAKPNDQTKILAVDDEEIVHASLKKILNRSGYCIETVFSAREGFECMNDKQYDLVIVDLMMPEINGIQFLEALKKRGSTTPVLVITGYPTIPTAVQALRLGAVDYIAKPFTRKELMSPLVRALSIDDPKQTLQPGKEEAIPDRSDLVPGTVVVLPRHSWAKYDKEGTFVIGIEASFLNICGSIEELLSPCEMDMVEQGYVGFQLRNMNQEEHSVAIPLSGQVVELNHSLLNNPHLIDSETWLVRIIPSHLDEELGRLIKREGPGHK